jgi:hypothetical protein
MVVRELNALGANLYFATARQIGIYQDRWGKFAMISFVFEIFIRSISGYIFIVPGIILYFLHLKKIGKKQTKAHILLCLYFAIY